MCAQGTPPAIVQTGNEVTNGMLWAKSSEYDEGREHLLYDQQWPAFARLMKQAIRGVREADGPPGHHPKVMLHIDKGHSPGIAAWWFDKARAYEIDFDIIGLSYYFLHHEEANLEGIVRLACLSASFPGKEIMLAETSYPYRPVPGMARFPSPNDPPFTREGQKEYLSRALDAMRHVPNGAGLCWWGAFFVNDAIEPCNDDFRAQALFDETGIPLLALSAFGE
jgi:arabinogalactan endo-1,4-beta-galactosidase